ncbi:MAG: DUF3857 domain-containing protein [Candidatus Omnitrophota bacterium]
MKRIIFFISVFLFLGCNFNTADYFAKKSEYFYEKAIKQYKKALNTTKVQDEIKFKLAELYFSHKDYDLAIEQLKPLSQIHAQKMLAISYYQTGDYTQSLGIFERLGEPKDKDDEYLYYWGLTCEKLNLYTKAKELYEKIKDIKFKDLAKKRLSEIYKYDHQKKLSDLDPETQKIIRECPPSKNYPNAGALVLFSESTIKVLTDNTLQAQEHVLVKIINERGKREFSEIALEYDSTYEKIELEYARTIKPDGTVIFAGDKDIRDVSKYLNFPLYSNARIRIISMPEISDGAIIEYRAKTIRNQLINKKDFVLSYHLEETEPVLKDKITLILPENKKPNLKFINQEYNKSNFDLNPKVSLENKQLFFKWEFKNIPQILPEPDMPPISEINPAVLVSTFNSWEEIYKWWHDLAKDKIKADEDIKRKTQEIIRNKNTPLEKAHAIYYWCTENIRYVAVEYGQAGYEPHSATEVFKNKYGDCKDQAILLVTMLRLANIKAYPVLIGTKEAYGLIEDFPTLVFNHAIACIDLDNKFIFLDPTAETCSFGDLPAGDQDRKVLIIQDTNYKIYSTPLYEAKHNLIRIVSHIKIYPDEKIWVNRFVETRGQFDQIERFWIKYTPPQLLKENLQDRVQVFAPGGQLLHYNFKNINERDKPIRLIFNFIAPEYLAKAQDLRILPSFAHLDLSSFSKEKRTYPLDYKIPTTFEKIVEIDLPSNLCIKYLPKALIYDTPWLKYKNKYIQKNNRLYFIERKIFKKPIINLSEYAEFKKFCEELARKISEKVILEKKEK